MGKEGLKDEVSKEVSKVISLSKEDLTKQYDELVKSYNETINKISELSAGKLKLEGALINLQELIKKFE